MSALKIAVFENDKQQTISIFDQGFITTYDGVAGNWKVLNQFENKVCDATSIGSVRKVMDDIVNQLNDIKMVVASHIQGVAFTIFEDAGIGIFLVDGNSLDILDSVRKQTLEALEEQLKRNQQFDITPVLERGIKKGDFRLDLRDALTKNPDFTSKSILLPYLKDGAFNRLFVICDHVPKWFLQKLGELGLEYETVSEQENKKTVQIVHIHMP